jgi:hypothetical protein
VFILDKLYVTKQEGELLMKQFVSYTTVIVTIAVLMFSLPALAESTTFDELAASYEKEKLHGAEATELKRELLSIADTEKKDLPLWKSLFDNGLSSEKKIANALLLIERLYPEGDVSRWEEVSGMMHPSLVPSPLAAVDGVYVAARELAGKDEKGSKWLARELINDLADSSRGKMYFINTAPAEYELIISVLESEGFHPDYGKWPEARIEGNLPLASPVRGYIGFEYAMSRGLIFLNAWGEIANNGTYAWNRRKGRIYRVVDSERDNGIFIP